MQALNPPPIRLLPDLSAVDWSRCAHSDDQFCPRTPRDKSRFKNAIGPMAAAPPPYNVQQPPKVIRTLSPQSMDDLISGEVDARIYIRNVPQEYTEDFIRGVVAQYGDATVVELLRSRLMNGRRSGFIHMKSHKSAALAVDAI